MAIHVKCGTLFTGNEDVERSRQTLVVDARGRLAYVGPTDSAPLAAEGDEVLDYADLFVMPGLHDVHTHLAYGNAKTEEDIDLYQPMEFRALRAMFFAQKCLAAGYTSICAPGDAGQISLSVRNAINFGLFDGPRVTASGRYLTTRQGLTDWYPTWIGVPDTSIGRLVTSRDESIEEIRVQVKNGVDCIKVALDGVQRRPDGELIAAFDQEEIDAIVREAHRLGRKVVVHARGREATLYAARAGVDLIFHALLPRPGVHRRHARERLRRSGRRSPFRATSSTSRGPPSRRSSRDASATCSASTRPRATTCARRAAPASR